jgi:hypothetical protein
MAYLKHAILECLEELIKAKKFLARDIWPQDRESKP